MTDYSSYSNEQLINRINELEAQLLELKRGYIYVLQFEKDIDEGIYKAGKTDNIENRFANYRSIFGDELGQLNIIRVAAVNDSLAAEQYMHDLIRKSGVQSINDEKRNKKSTTKSEWYINHDMELIEDAFEKTMNKFGMEADDMVRKYDTYAKGSLSDELVPITHFKDQPLKENMYFFNPLTQTVYKQVKHGLDVMRVQKSTNKYGMRKIDGQGCAVPLEYIVKEYGS